MNNFGKFGVRLDNIRNTISNYLPRVFVTGGRLLSSVMISFVIPAYKTNTDKHKRGANSGIRHQRSYIQTTRLMNLHKHSHEYRK